MSIEAKLYKPIENFASEYFGCHVVKQQVGTKFVRVDVVGLKENRGDLDSTSEVIAIEVKEEKASFLQAVGQTRAYSIFAHRCYLAVKKRNNNEFTQDEKDIADQLGVGLIEVKSNKCDVKLTSKLFFPQERYVLQIFDKLNYFRCSLCRSIYPVKDITDINPNRNIDPQNDSNYLGGLKRAIENRKNARYYLRELPENHGDIRERVWDRRFICKDCVSIFASI
jgi:hypothetical protein